MAETNRAAIIKLSVMSMSNIITPLAQLLQLNMSHVREIERESGGGGERRREDERYMQEQKYGR